jgi:K+-sensing histidine kinase KdpD|tara:strand:- start:173 stop:541 length:369 start_codon:yes stop_codon:yes gene_type:complete
MIGLLVPEQPQQYIRLPRLLRRSLARRISSLPEDPREIACNQSSDEIALDLASQTFEAGKSVFETNFTTKKHGGSFGLGLGLSISHKIVEKHSGTIYAENPKSVGARLIVNLPVYSEAGLSQ